MPDRVGGSVAVDHRPQRAQTGVRCSAHRSWQRRHVEQRGIQELAGLLDLLGGNHAAAVRRHPGRVLFRRQ